MLHLPNNCRAGKFSVSPANWKTQSARVNTIWRISYWFYDDNLKEKKQIPIKGMNRLETLQEKQQFVQAMIDNEVDQLKNRGYNPITNSYAAGISAEISSTTPVIDALQYAFEKLKVQRISDVKHCLEYVKGVIGKLGFSRIAIKDINSMHLTLVLEKCEEQKKKWSASSHNHYRSYLFMLFKRLVKMLVIPSNPVRDVEKRKETRRVREVLSKQERKRVREYLEKKSPAFLLFTEIFFHSSSRETEMLNVKACDVDLTNGRFKVLVKKGEFREEWRPIKDIAIPEWERAMNQAGPEDYVFSKGLRPGPVKINSAQISKRWRKVKKNLSITADFYAFKHKNLDEMAGALQKHKESIQQASETAGHTTPVVTLKHYLQGEADRQHDTIKKVWNEF